jgi:hypothetical protein
VSGELFSENQFFGRSLSPEMRGFPFFRFVKVRGKKDNFSTFGFGKQLLVVGFGLKNDP